MGFADDVARLDRINLSKLTKPDRGRLYTLARRMQSAYERGCALLTLLVDVPYTTAAERVRGEIEGTLANLVDDMTALNDISQILDLSYFPDLQTKEKLLVEAKAQAATPLSPDKEAAEAEEMLRTILTD